MTQTTLVLCDFHAVRSTLTHLILAQQNKPVVSAGVTPAARDPIFNALASRYDYDIERIPSTPLSAIDLSKIDRAICYSTKGYQMLLDQKRTYPDLQIIFWSLNVPDFSTNPDATFKAFIDKISTLIQTEL